MIPRHDDNRRRRREHRAYVRAQWENRRPDPSGPAGGGCAVAVATAAVTLLAVAHGLGRVRGWW